MLEIMTKEKLRTFIIVLGVLVVFFLTTLSFSSSLNTNLNREAQSELVKQYEKIPHMIAPLQILARGLNVVNK
jgi:hypothetical protein